MNKNSPNTEEILDAIKNMMSEKSVRQDEGLPKDVIELIEQNKISQGHAKVLVGLNNSLLIARKIIDKKLSVRQAENLVKIFRQNKSSLKKAKDPNLNQLEISLSEKIGLSVFIRNKKNNSGSILFEYKGLDQLNKIIDIVKANY